ncbi:MAG: M56 family metallopeptidase [Dehalococcoidia bacterium]
MHPLLGLGSLVAIVAFTALSLPLLPRVQSWSLRRDLELGILAAPIASLGVSILGLRYGAGNTCFLGPLPLDYRVNIGLALTMGIGVVYGLSCGIVRPLILHRTVARQGEPASAALAATVARLSRELGIRPPRLLVYPRPRPVALVYGVRVPTLLLSTWMLAELDREELRTVIAHELAHIARRDFATVWLAAVLRDVFWYLPTSRLVYRRLQAEKEPACDDVAVQLTRCPLALASALAKVWQQAARAASPGMAQALTDVHGSIEARITRLLTGEQHSHGAVLHAARVRTAGILAIGSLLVFEAAAVAALISPTGCGSMIPLGKLF